MFVKPPDWYYGRISVLPSVVEVGSNFESIQIIDSPLDWESQIWFREITVNKYVNFVLRHCHCKKWNLAQEILEESLCV